MFNGEIVFTIADINCIVVDFGAEMMPTKIVNKGDVVALGRKAPRNRWLYEEVSITIYMRSDFAEIGYSIPSYILKKLSLLDCTLNFEILSFGMAVDL